MKAKHRQSGLSIMEEVVVVAIIAIFVVLGVPAIRTFLRSLESEGSAKAMIDAALATGRAIAAKEHRYAGVRFQNKYEQDGPGCQYMIFVVYDFDKTQLANGFRAVEGYKPVKLPDSVGVMDLKVGDVDVTDNFQIDTPAEVNDMTTFSVVFSSSGKLLIHPVRIKRADVQDDIFNTKANVQNGIGMFVQDDYQSEGFGEEASRNSFYIYDRAAFEKLNPNSRYDDYLEVLTEIFINPYTGTMIEK